MKACCRACDVSTACHVFVWWVWNLGSGVGGGCGTLLGFEGSHSSCLLLFMVALLVWLWVLVGWVVDSWIVDASILCALPCNAWLLLHQVRVGWVVRGLCSMPLSFFDENSVCCFC